MSDTSSNIKLGAVLLAIFVAVCVSPAVSAYFLGKHSADRYYANNPKVVYVTETYDAQTGKLIKYCESLTGHPCGKDKIELTDPTVPAGIGKPQATTEGYSINAGTGMADNSYPVELGPVTDGCKKGEVAIVSQAVAGRVDCAWPAHPLKLGKPSAKWHRTTHQECESETQREYKSMEGWATGDPAITLGDETFDAGTQELWSKQPCGWSDNANPPNIRPRYVYSQKGIEREITEQEFNKKELGKRKPAHEYIWPAMKYNHGKTQQSLEWTEGYHYGTEDAIMSVMEVLDTQEKIYYFDPIGPLPSKFTLRMEYCNVNHPIYCAGVPTPQVQK